MGLSDPSRFLFIGQCGVQDRTIVRQATSRKAREVAHPQLLRSMLKDKPALYFPVKVAHPP